MGSRHVAHEISEHMAPDTAFQTWTWRTATDPGSDGRDPESKRGVIMHAGVD